MKPSNIRSKTESAKNETLYAKHEKIYLRITFGFFTRLKSLSGIILLGIY